MRAPALLLAVALVLGRCSWPVRVGAQSIGVFFDPRGQACAGAIPTGVPTDLYVLARLTGPILGGITGAELRVEGLPSTWTVFTSPSPRAAVQLGSLLPSGGAVAFAQCQTGPVVLYTIHITIPAGAQQQDVQVRVTARTPPGNPDFGCPVVALCDAPAFTKVCVVGRRAVINPTGPVDCTEPTDTPEISAIPGLSIRQVGPNPATHDLLVVFSLPRRDPARLQLLAVNGKRVWERDVGSLDDGTHVLRIAGRDELAAGIYVLRLVQGDQSASTKVVVVR